MKLFINRVIALIIDSLLIGIPVGIIEMAFSLIRWILSWLPFIYLYRPARLEKDLSCASCEALLSACGYNCRGGSRCLTRLARRLKQQEDFPHEIGLFLSYPPEDVKGFLEHRPCKCVGCWKVYENEEAARKTFAKYKACTRVYCRQLASGIDIERLTVAG